MLHISIAINNCVLWHITAHNDSTGTEEIGNYNVEAYEVDRGACGRPRPKLNCSFRIEGFNRDSGALKLARTIMERIKRKTNKEDLLGEDIYCGAV